MFSTATKIIRNLIWIWWLAVQLAGRLKNSIKSRNMFFFPLVRKYNTSASECVRYTLEAQLFSFQMEDITELSKHTRIDIKWSVVGRMKNFLEQFLQFFLVHVSMLSAKESLMTDTVLEKLIKLKSARRGLCCEQEFKMWSQCMLAGSDDSFMRVLCTGTVLTNTVPSVPLHSPSLYSRTRGCLPRTLFQCP
ncbi:hypothetical protein PR048_013728 [Dryococelus australis]|uniref:Uncharacterized protein n=1 Tax=Dryococelus australis TaxID=614101 RepID=A0ABQ9HUJ8_9NEOP|nr:hypothetical protein PR048_013728 [Dryococelus australis]